MSFIFDCRRLMHLKENLIFQLNQNQSSQRSSKTYEEHFSRTSRLYNSPLFSIRRILNNTPSDDSDPVKQNYMDLAYLFDDLQYTVAHRIPRISIHFAPKPLHVTDSLRNILDPCLFFDNNVRTLPYPSVFVSRL